jgi:hypothetical protein
MARRNMAGAREGWPAVEGRRSRGKTKPG